MDSLVEVGIDHLAAPLAVREKAAIPAARIGELVRALVEERVAREAIVVSTCNRTEIYAISEERDAAGLLLAVWRRFAPSAPAESEGPYRSRTGEVAAEHLFRVAAGLESAIVGETEILGQVKEALRIAHEAGAAGSFLERLATSALHAGKRARTETALSRGAVSHGQAAFEVARQIFGGLKNRTVLVVGAGEMAAGASKALTALPGGAYVFANRTREHAEALAAAIEGSVVAGLEEVPSRLHDAHVAVFAGGDGALTLRAVEAAVAKRREPLLVLDYGVPRCVDPAVGRIAGVFLYDLEAIEAWMAKALASRRDAIPAAQSILAEELGKFRSWSRTRVAAPVLQSLRAWAEALRKAELDRIPPDASPATRAAVEEATRRLVERFLRRPASRLSQGAEREDPALPTPEHLKRVFGLTDDGDAGGSA